MAMKSAERTSIDQIDPTIRSPAQASEYRDLTCVAYHKTNVTKCFTWDV